MTIPRAGSITDVPGIEVGHAQDDAALTGCTVLLCRKGAVAGVDVRGSAPGTRAKRICSIPINLVEKVHAVLLAGGSAFGLDAAGGVMRYLEEQKIGFNTGVARVPIVPAAILFDLAIGNKNIRPDAEMGYKACLAASKRSLRGRQCRSRRRRFGGKDVWYAARHEVRVGQRKYAVRRTGCRCDRCGQCIWRYYQP